LTDLIERIDRERKRVLRTYLLGAALFFGAWMTRFVLRELGALSETMDIAVAVPFALGLAVLLYSFFTLNRVRKEIAARPELKEALNDERVRLSNLIAFKFGFFAMLGGLAFFAVFNLLWPIKDLMAVLLGLFMIGAWGYLLAFYRLERD
jgi:hypothetical protein